MVKDHTYVSPRPRRNQICTNMDVSSLLDNLMCGREAGRTTKGKSERKERREGETFIIRYIRN